MREKVCKRERARWPSYSRRFKDRADINEEQKGMERGYFIGTKHETKKNKKIKKIIQLLLPVLDPSSSRGGRPRRFRIIAPKLVLNAQSDHE